MDVNLLHGVLSPKAVASDPETLARFAVDGLEPEAVVYPATLNEAAEVLKAANSEKWAVIVMGSGTKMALGKVPPRVDLVLSTSRLDKIIDIDTANLTVTVQAGVKLADLQDLLGGSENRCFFPIDGNLREQADYMCSGRDYKGVFLPLDPPYADKATVGGIVATNSTGPKRLRYGLPRDLVLGIRYVAPTGEVIGMGGKTVKNVSGYDVSKLMIGSMGTLGILGDMTARLLPLPERVDAMLFSFPDLDKAKSFADNVFGTRLLPTSLELLDSTAFALTGAAEVKASIGGWVAAVGLEGFREEVVREISDLKDIGLRSGASDLTELGKDGAGSFWTKMSDLAASQVAKGKIAIKFKGTFPISRYADVLSAWTSAASGNSCAFTSSAGVGVAYAYAFGDTGADPDGIAKLGASFREAALSHGGSLVMEAAPPAVKRKLDPWGDPRNDFPLMQKIKGNLDPLGVLNPGRFLGGL